MMHTLQIGDEWPSDRPGGLNSYYADLVQHLHQHGVSSDGLVVGTESVDQASNGAAHAFARADASLLQRLIAARRSARSRLLTGTIDVIAVHFALYGLPILDELRRRPTVIHFHGPWSSESSVENAGNVTVRLKKMLEQKVYETGRRVIVLSHAFQREVTARYGISEASVRVVPGGVDTDRFQCTMSRAEARAQLGWPQDRPILLSVRRLVRRMGLENLIESARILSGEQRDFLLYIGGIGPLANELGQRVQDAGLQRHVRFLGRVPHEELPIAYQAADLTIVPSQSLEGFGLTAVESLASGTPVFATNVGGLPEIINPFAPQCIFKDSTAEAIAGGLRDALTSLEGLPSRDACRTYAVEAFSWRNVSAQVAQVYREALR